MRPTLPTLLLAGVLAVAVLLYASAYALTPVGVSGNYAPLSGADFTGNVTAPNIMSKTATVSIYVNATSVPRSASWLNGTKGTLAAGSDNNSGLDTAHPLKTLGAIRAKIAAIANCLYNIFAAPVFFNEELDLNPSQPNNPSARINIFGAITTYWTGTVTGATNGYPNNTTIIRVSSGARAAGQYDGAFLGYSTLYGFEHKNILHDYGNSYPYFKLRDRYENTPTGRCYVWKSRCTINGGGTRPYNVYAYPGVQSVNIQGFRMQGATNSAVWLQPGFYGWVQNNDIACSGYDLYAVSALALYNKGNIYSVSAFPVAYQGGCYETRGDWLKTGQMYIAGYQDLNGNNLNYCDFDAASLKVMGANYTNNMVGCWFHGTTGYGTTAYSTGTLRSSGNNIWDTCSSGGADIERNSFMQFQSSDTIKNCPIGIYYADGGGYVGTPTFSGNTKDYSGTGRTVACGTATLANSTAQVNSGSTYLTGSQVKFTALSQFVATGARGPVWAKTISPGTFVNFSSTVATGTFYWEQRTQ